MASTSHLLTQNHIHSSDPHHSKQQTCRKKKNKLTMKTFEPRKQGMEEDVRKGPWTLDEDDLLIEYIAHHGEGRWNLLAKSSGLRRTGKSCRLRWLNYLKPDIKRGNLTAQEQLKILELHAEWGNRWSKIARCLPGRTDNEIKNYWRTRVQKQARKANMESNSQSFIDALRCSHVPRLVQRIEQKGDSSTAVDPTAAKHDQTFKGSSSSSSSWYSSESSKTSNPVECSGCSNEGDTRCRDSSALPSDDWYYVDRSSRHDMAEPPSMSADHGWISSDMAGDTWTLDGLW